MFESTMVNSIFILAILSIFLVQETTGHGALIEPPMRSVLWKYGFDAPTNYNYMELYCGGLKNFQNNGGRCGVCGDSLQGPFHNERGGKYDRGIIARSYPRGTTSIEVKVEITAYHKGYFEFKLCPNDEAEVTQDCLNKYALMIEEGIEQGDPMKFYPPSGPSVYSLKVSIPPDIRCERCVLQWTYRAGNGWGTSTDGRSCLGCGVQETFVNCADISFGGHSSMVNTRFRSFDPKDQTAFLRQNLNGIGANNTDHSLREIGTRRHHSNNIIPLLSVAERPIQVKETHPNSGIAAHTRHRENNFENQQAVESAPSVHQIHPISNIQHDMTVLSGSDNVHDEITSRVSFERHNKESLSPIGQGQQTNDIKDKELEIFLAKLPQDNKVINENSKNDRRQAVTVIDALRDTLRPFDITGAVSVKPNVHSDPQGSDPRSVFHPIQSQWVNGNSNIRSRVPLADSVNNFPYNNISKTHFRLHPVVAHDGMVLNSRESGSNEQLRSLPVQSRAASTIPRNSADQSQLQIPFQDTAWWNNQIQIPVHQGNSLFGQQQQPIRISHGSTHFFPENEIHLANPFDRFVLGIRQPNGVVTGLSPEVQARMSRTSLQAHELYQRLAYMASINNAQHLRQNLQHASQMPH